MTPMMTQIVQLLYQAAETEWGISVLTDAPAILRARLQRAKQELKDPSLSGLRFRLAPGRADECVFIVKEREVDASQVG